MQFLVVKSPLVRSEASGRLNQQGIGQANTALSTSWPGPKSLGNAGGLLGEQESFRLDDLQRALQIE